MSEQQRIPVAVYMRVSSDDQRDRETIKTQREAVERFLQAHPEYQAVRWYADDGVSGTVPLAKRPQGRLLVSDAHAGLFAKIIVYRASRLGREEEDLFRIYNFFEALEIELVGVMEPLNDRMVFGFQALMESNYRRKFLAELGPRHGPRRPRGPLHGRHRPLGLPRRGPQADRQAGAG